MDAGQCRRLQGPLHLTKFKGGQSNPTYKIEAPSGQLCAAPQAFWAAAPVSACGRSRIQGAIAGLYPTGFPVARQYGLCTDENVIGSWFYVMGMVDGRTIWDGAMPDASGPDERRATLLR
jgi:aminoglycoside phosphotransferase (APT) family kinase protein